MYTAYIQLKISGGEMVDGIMRFDPGSVLQAGVIFASGEPIKYHALRIAVEWHTEGYGNRDHGKADEKTLVGAGVLKPGSLESFQVSLALPTEPWSYAGNLINIIWEVKASIDPTWGRDIQEGRRFILAPGAARPPYELALR